MEEGANNNNSTFPGETSVSETNAKGIIRTYKVVNSCLEQTVDNKPEVAANVLPSMTSFYREEILSL